jgi:hypothetical protein
MRGQADDHVVPDNGADVSRREIVLSNVNASGAGESCDVGSIVHDHDRANISCACDNRARCIEQFTPGPLFGADLQEPGSTRQAGGREIDE